MKDVRYRAFCHDCKKKLGDQYLQMPKHDRKCFDCSKKSMDSYGITEQTKKFGGDKYGR